MRMKSANRRLEIIRTARDLFSEKDYYGTKISDITNRLEISQGTFYNYFKNKEDIFTYIVEIYIKRLRKIFIKENPKLSNNAIEFKEQLIRLGSELFDAFAEDQNMYDIVFFRSKVSCLEIENEVKKLLHHTDLFVEKYLVHGVNKKFLRNVIDTSLIAKAIRGMIMVAIEDLMVNNTPVQLKERWIASLANFVICGMS